MKQPLDLSAYQALRYARNIAVCNIGRRGQLKLLGSKVAVIGCGALGSIVAAYLAGAGVGNLLLVDFDTIDISNLQRQVYYKESDTGKSKTAALSSRLKELNHEIKIETCDSLLTKKNASDILTGTDFVVDATDNPASKKLIDCICLDLGIACCIGGINEMAGQLTVCTPGSTRYSELFPDAGENGFLPCSIAGVLGPAAGVLASLQAAETIKYLCGIQDSLVNKLLTFDLLKPSFKVINMS